jgi:SNF2 family DNA or RNA helicase
MVQLTEIFIAQEAAVGVYFNDISYQDIIPKEIDLNVAVFISENSRLNFPSVGVLLDNNEFLLSCNCTDDSGKLCEHQSKVLMALIHREELRVFFDLDLRKQKLKKIAQDYGLENESNLDLYFQIDYQSRKTQVKSRITGLIPMHKESFDLMQQDFFIGNDTDEQLLNANKSEQSLCVVIRKHRYYKHLTVELYKAAFSLDGKIKNPLNLVDPLDLIWDTKDPEELKFFSAISRFQNPAEMPKNNKNLDAIKSIINNPTGYKFYYHQSDKSEKVTVASVLPINVAILNNGFSLITVQHNQFFEIYGALKIRDKEYHLKDLTLLFSYFILIENTLYLINSLPVLNLLGMLKKNGDHLLIHQSKFKEFKFRLLDKIEERIDVNYPDLKPASKEQIKENGFYKEIEKIIYLSDFGQHVMLIPVMRYGEVEIQIRSRKQIYGADKKGQDFLVKRKDAEEIAFISLLMRQHPHLEEQIENDLTYFYLHKKFFLDETWFLKSFEDWRNNDITVLGFNELEGNQLNPNKAKIDIKVLSGINWFNTDVQVKFGNKKASLKHLHKSIRKKSKYVQLDDGTLGILPNEWVEKFQGFFTAGEVLDDDILQIPKINFSMMEDIFEDHMMDEEVKKEISVYKEKVEDFSQINEVIVSDSLKATLRPYQKEGLNWLNFLDDFNFGGCLADDMGLGKSMQILAFILSQREKYGVNTNLIVVPATLIFNWEKEIQLYAPSLKVLTLYGTERIKNVHYFNAYEVILTSYGTLLSDINFLKHYHFNYVFLDESQHIKNPQTQRYKAAKLLRSRNKITITGTPIENNTFDLYGQLSLACPGLLGTKQHFKEVYAIPIDQFKESRRAEELQKKIKPFVLRRTKQEVAQELPEKTEMVLYCKMGIEQRKIYDAYEREFKEFISATTAEELKKSPMNVLKGLTKLRQICDSPALLVSDGIDIDAPSSKIELLVEQIENKAGQHKILVFSQFVSMLHLIERELTARDISSAILTGNTRNREKVVEEFQRDANIKVFLISLKVGGTGLNLIESDYVFLVEPWWNPAVEQQAIDRVHRIGQLKKVVAVRLICPDTVEEKIMQLQKSKKDLVKELIQTDGAFLQKLSKKDLLSLFRN